MKNGTTKNGKDNLGDETRTALKLQAAASIDPSEFESEEGQIVNVGDLVWLEEKQTGGVVIGVAAGHVVVRCAAGGGCFNTFSTDANSVEISYSADAAYPGDDRAGKKTRAKPKK